MAKVFECIKCFRVGGYLEPDFIIGVSKSHDIVGHHHNLSKCPCKDDIFYQTSQQVQPLCAECVVHEGCVFLG